MRFTQATQPHSLRLAPRSAKKKKENRMRAQNTKAVGARLEDFVDWTGIISSEPAEEEEMSSISAGFSIRMHNRAAGSKGETTPISCGKWSKRLSPDEKA